MLAWLLNPNENHGLDESVIKGFIQYAITSFSDNEDVFDTLLMDFRSFNVYREWHHIDVLAVSDKEKYILCIENKIDTGEHDNQLSKYQVTLDNTYPDYKKPIYFFRLRVSNQAYRILGSQWTTVMLLVSLKMLAKKYHYCRKQIC